MAQSLLHMGGVLLPAAFSLAFRAACLSRGDNRKSHTAIATLSQGRHRRRGVVRRGAELRSSAPFTSATVFCVVPQLGCPCYLAVSALFSCPAIATSLRGFGPGGAFVRVFLCVSARLLVVSGPAAYCNRSDTSRSAPSPCRMTASKGELLESMYISWVVP